MSFLGSPCPCGWVYQDIENNIRECERCHRKWIKQDWGWEQITTKNDIIEPETCRHNQLIGEVCSHCPDSIAEYVATLYRRIR